MDYIEARREAAVSARRQVSAKGAGRRRTATWPKSSAMLTASDKRRRVDQAYKHLELDRADKLESRCVRDF